MLEVPDRWDPARPGRQVFEFWVYSEDQWVDTIDAFKYGPISGSVTETRVSGIRSTLSLSLPPSKAWRELLALPRLMLMPWAGMSWGETRHMMPLGVFPILGRPGYRLPYDRISVSAQDNWQYIAGDDFLGPLISPTGEIKFLAADLIKGVGLDQKRIDPVTYRSVDIPVVASSSAARLDTAVVWSRSKSDTIMELCESIGAEVFFNRIGQPIIRNRDTQPGRDLSEIQLGSVEQTIDWSGVKNVVTVGSSNNDAPSFNPAIAQITSPVHPAYPGMIGRRVLNMTSPLVSSYAQATEMALTVLDSRAKAAVSFQVDCLPDPSRECGDELWLDTREGGTRVTVEEVTHPIGAGWQQLKLGVAW